MKQRLVRAADLFCGLGGTSTGLSQFCKEADLNLELVAVNHWERAVESHAANHPKAAHFCQDLRRLKPREAVPSGKLDLLLASPECTHHSNARGGTPMEEQSRSSAWVVMEWLTALQVDNFLIENVVEFEKWGPLTKKGRPHKRLIGTLYNSFLAALRSAGYDVSIRVVNSADHGAFTSRRRLFIQGTKFGAKAIRWPNPTHSQDGLSLRKWEGANNVIDWNFGSRSIFHRKRDLVPKTFDRIEEGLWKFGGPNAAPFVAAIHDYKKKIFGNSCNYNEPKEHKTLLTSLKPFIVPQLTGGSPRSVDDPLPTLTTTSRGVGLAQPFLLQLTHGGRIIDPNRPMPTITCAKRGEIGVLEPFIVSMRGDGPLPHRSKSLKDPVPCITAGGRHTALVQPYVIPFYGQTYPDSLDDPLSTVTTRSRFSLVEPMAALSGDYIGLDIHFRMLQPHELAAAMGFPQGYIIKGNQEDQVKQVGNAVEVKTARALTGAILSRF